MGFNYLMSSVLHSGTRGIEVASFAVAIGSCSSRTKRFPQRRDKKEPSAYLRRTQEQDRAAKAGPACDMIVIAGDHVIAL